jgi:hypothetical protein
VEFSVERVSGVGVLLLDLKRNKKTLGPHVVVLIHISCAGAKVIAAATINHPCL